MAALSPLVARAQELARRHPRATAVMGAASMLTLAFLLFVPVARFERPLSAVLLARDGSLLSATTARDEQWRFPPRDDVPAKFGAALVRFEDRRFFWHPGVDVAAVLRALRSNLRARRVVSGASTLTMQVIRLWRDGKPRTLPEKLLEAVLALRLELARDKQAVLALYASHAPFGGNVIGLDAASWRYFGVPPERLSWAEAATLAVLPNSPSLVHPGRNRDRLLARRNRLLDDLRVAGTIDEATCDAARSEPLPPEPLAIPQLAPHLLGRLTRAARAPVKTTIDPELQRRVAAVVARHQASLAGNHVFSAAALVLDVETGEALAYVGNTAPDDAPEHGAHVDCLTAPRSTGSVLKPLLYAAALDTGELLPTELLEDTPLRVGGFAPENFTRTYAGAVPASVAVARSLNVPAARLLQEYGVDRFHALLTKVGMTTLTKPGSHYGLALILGGAEGTVWDLTGVYASLARLVVRASRDEETTATSFPPRVELKDRPAARASASPIGAGAAYVMLQAMLEVERPGVDASWREFTEPRRVAWKTGTSFGFRDAWAIGVTPRYAVGVWAGNTGGEGRPGLTGFGAAAPILFDVFGTLPSSGWFHAPTRDLVPVTVCRHSGQRAGPACRDTEIIEVPRAGLEGHPCAYCQVLHLNASGTHRVHGGCEPVHAMKTVERFVLPPGVEWFYRMRRADYAPVPPWRTDCTSALGTSGVSLSIIYPKPDTAVYVPRELDGRRGRSVLEAAHRDPRATIYWHLDDQYLGLTRDIHQMSVAPAPGRHVLTLVDHAGERLERRFTVLEKPKSGGAQ